MKKIITIAALAALSTPAFAATLANSLNTGNGTDVEVFTAANITAEFGQALDDTYDGQVSITWTMEYNALDGGGADNTFGLLSFNSAGGNVGVGNYFFDTFYGAGVGDDASLANSGATVVIDDPQVFTLLIDFNAGADDTAFLSGGGYSNEALAARSYSFDNITARGGNGSTSIDFTNGTITAVPEPSSTALLGLGGLALILRRRK